MKITCLPIGLIGNGISMIKRGHGIIQTFLHGRFMNESFPTQWKDLEEMFHTEEAASTAAAQLTTTPSAMRTSGMVCSGRVFCSAA
jgi:hypothetical protein